MKIKEILFATGQPGLYQYIAQGRSGMIVENVTDHKRTLFGSTAKVSGLADIAMYTNDGEKPLPEILQSIYDSQKGRLSIAKDSPVEQLKEFMDQAVPGYDKDKVHVSDIKKLVSWYNILVDAGMTDFTVDKEDEKNEQIIDKKDGQHQVNTGSSKTVQKVSQSKAKTPKNTTSRKSQ